MANSLFLCGTDQEAGSSVVALGLYGVLGRVVKRLAFFKPVGGGADDQDVAVMKSAYRLVEDAADLCPVTIEEARELVAQEQEGELLDRIARCYDRLRRGKQFVILEGINNQRAMSAFDMDINKDIAARLGTPVLLVARGSRRGSSTNVDQLVASVLTANRAFEEQQVDVLGVVVNRVEDKPFEEVRRRIVEKFEQDGIPLFGVLPSLGFLGYPKLDQIAAELDAEVIAGEEALGTVATKTIVAAMEPANFLRHLDTDKTLVVTPGDREEVLLTLACAQKSPRRRSVAGVVLTGGLRPNPEIVSLINDLGLPDFPVMLVQTDTFTTATKIQDIDARIRPQDGDKIHTARSAVAEHVEHDRLWETLEMPRPPRRRTGTAVFLEQIIEQARSSGKRIVLPEGEESRTVQAVGKILEMGVCPLIMLGDADTIHWAAGQVGFKLDHRVQIIDPLGPGAADRYLDVVVQARKGRPGGMTPEVACQWLEQSPINFGTAMVKAGDADGLVSGAVHSTGDTIRPALQIIRVKPEVGLASSVFFMALSDRVLVYGDCAIVPNPNARELAAIAYASARTARAFGIEPRVAMLSYSTGSSGAGVSVDKVAEATKLVKERNPDLIIDGPLQYDAAIDPEVGRLKQPDSPVAGRANVFIFPDLDAGNIAYKAVQRSAGAVAVGPVLQGLNKPVNDLSRGCSVDDIVYTVAVTAVQAAAH